MHNILEPPSAMNLKLRSSTLEIRPVIASDSVELDYVFYVTADTTLRSSPDRRTLPYASAVWCQPYAYLNIEHCFVLVLKTAEKGDGANFQASTSVVVGYILSTPDTKVFSERYATEYFPTLPEEITTPLPPGTDTTWRPDNLPNALLDKIQHMRRWPSEIEEEVPGVLERYPAHLHIDILPEWQAQGWGTKLMSTCLQKLRDEGVKGLHLQMVEGNTGARAFYKAVGFRQWGQSGKGEWCMVIEL